jgi:hypothetical protein
LIGGALEPWEHTWKNFSSCWRMIGIFAVARRWTEFCVAWSDVGQTKIAEGRRNAAIRR